MSLLVSLDRAQAQWEGSRSWEAWAGQGHGSQFVELIKAGAVFRSVERESWLESLPTCSSFTGFVRLASVQDRHSDCAVGGNVTDIQIVLLCEVGSSWERESKLRTLSGNFVARTQGAGESRPPSHTEALNSSPDSWDKA